MHDYKYICPNYRLFTQGKICEKCKRYKYYNCVVYKCVQNSYAYSFLAMLEMYLHKLILQSYQKIDVFISPSKFLKDKAEHWQQQAKIKQLYNFIDLAKYQPNQEIGEGLVYFGRLSEEKGLFVLLRAMKSLKKINLKIIGEGPLADQIKQYIKDNKLGITVTKGMKDVDIVDKILEAVEETEEEDSDSDDDEECPGGGTFGEDLEELDHCEKCKVWKQCVKKNEEMNE